MEQDKNLIEYLATHRSSFAEEPLNDVDAVILTYAAYFYLEKGPLGRIEPGGRLPLPLALCGVVRTDLFGPGLLMRMDGDVFLPALLESSRFMELEVGRYVDDLSAEMGKQFCAMTFYLPDGSVFAAFRGSDNSLAGWKENFNLSFMEAVPSQLSARDYVASLAQEHTGLIRLGGHSKGGNLAEYAALTCDDEVYERIGGVWCVDSPGFAHRPSERIDSDGYASKLHKIIPESSIFGLMMEDRPEESRRVVESDGFLFAQHSPLRWPVEDGDFVDAGKVSPEAAVIASTINKWAFAYEPEKRELFINTVFSVLGAADAQYWSDNYSLESWIAIASAAIQLPAEMRNAVLGMMGNMPSVLGSETVRRAREVVGRQGS